MYVIIGWQYHRTLFSFRMAPYYPGTVRCGSCLLPTISLTGLEISIVHLLRQLKSLGTGNDYDRVSIVWNPPVSCRPPTEKIWNDIEDWIKELRGRYKALPAMNMPIHTMHRSITWVRLHMILVLLDEGLTLAAADRKVDENNRDPDRSGVFQQKASWESSGEAAIWCSEYLTSTTTPRGYPWDSSP